MFLLVMSITVVADGDCVVVGARVVVFVGCVVWACAFTLPFVVAACVVGFSVCAWCVWARS